MAKRLSRWHYNHKINTLLYLHFHFYYIIAILFHPHTDVLDDEGYLPTEN